MTKTTISPARKGDIVCVVRRFNYRDNRMVAYHYTMAFLAKVAKASRDGLVTEYEVIGENFKRRVAYMLDDVMTIASKQEEAKRLVASWTPADIEINRGGFDDAQKIRDAILAA